MNFAVLSLLAPLAAGFHPGTPACNAPGGCAPATPGYLAGCGPSMSPPFFTMACAPIGPPAPVLMAKIVAPTGTRVTAFPGSPDAKLFPTPTIFGLRPGYVYRMALGGIPNQPDVVLYPEIVVHASLVPRAAMDYRDYPAAIAFSVGDLERASAGSVVTKVIYLEDPKKAIAAASNPDRPFENPVSTEADAIKAAYESGRVVMVVRLGNRAPTATELSQGSVPGTVLLPGDTALSAPTAPPQFAWCGIPLYDPISGPKIPSEECFTDGGDGGPRLGIGRRGALGGLDSTDVAAEYLRGAKRYVTTSNIVCICVPRFAVQRVDTGLAGLASLGSTSANVQQFGALSHRSRILAQDVLAKFKPVGLETRIRPMVQVGREGLEILVGQIGPAKILATIEGVQVASASVAPEEVTNAGELVVIKEVDPKSGVKIGEEVTFTLTYKNNTRQPVSELILSDSLSGRLEYVNGSAQSDRPVNTTTEPNEAGSVVVRFEVSGVIPAGQGGVVKFKAKVR